MKKFTKMNESLTTLIEPKLEEDEFLNMKKAMIQMLEESINSSDIEIAKKFIEGYLNNSESNFIIGFVNDSDIYDFYVKYIDNIDQILIKKEFFTKSPSELEISSVYKYIIEATKIAFNDLLTQLQKIM